MRKIQNEESLWKCEHLSTLQSHLSAICDFVSIENWIFSCGARAQIFAWQVKDQIIVRSGQFMLHPLRRRHGGGGTTNDENKKENEDDHGLDVRQEAVLIEVLIDLEIHSFRFTSIAAMSEEEKYLIFITGSDAVLRYDQ